MIDDLVRLASCSSMVFTARGSEWPPRTVLVPTGGGAPAASAARVAFEIAGPEAGQAVDLMVVGTNVRAGTQRLYLGPRVERIVREAPCSTLIFNT